MKFRMLGVLLMSLLVALGSAAAKDVGSNSESYLALGDSVPFGYIEEADYEYYYPANFVSYSDYLSGYLGGGWVVVNASCPGETTSSFLSPLAPDNGCHQYRSYFPLHETYASIHSTQYTFATGFLRLNLATTPLVTIMLGVDDLLLLEEQCNGNPQCIENGLPEAYATAEANMTQILAGLRGTGYMGSIVIVNYYSPDYSNQFDTQAIPGLNQAITAPAQQYGADVADVFTAFQSAASNQFDNRLNARPEGSPARPTASRNSGKPDKITSRKKRLLAADH